MNNSSGSNSTKKLNFQNSFANSEPTSIKRKTAVVHPYGWSKQRSFQEQKREHSYSSLPPTLDQKRTTQKPQENRIKALIRSSFRKNTTIASTGDKCKKENIVLTKPLLDYIDELCVGAPLNIDRTKFAKEHRRKSLSKERSIGIKQFFKYSSLFGDKKEHELHNVPFKNFKVELKHIKCPQHVNFLICSDTLFLTPCKKFPR